VINGNSIRGMNGLIRANIQDETNVTYDLLFANVNNQGYNLIRWNNQPMVSGYELFYSLNNGQWSWADDLTNATAGPNTIANTNYETYWTNYNAFIGMATNIWYDYQWETNIFSNFQWIGQNWTNAIDVCYVKTNLLISKLKNYYFGTPTFKNIITFETDNLGSFAQMAANNTMAFLTNYFNGQLMSDWLKQNNLTQFNSDNFGSLLYMGDGSLYGLYTPNWWGATQDTTTRIFKLLDSSGNLVIQQVSLGTHGNAFPTMFKFAGNFLYFRYATLDGGGQETGFHQLARINMLTGQLDEINFSGGMSGTMEITSYDVSADNGTLYVSGVDAFQNAFLTYKVDMAHGFAVSSITNQMFDQIRVF
jgi:hypothetical protein